MSGDAPVAPTLERTLSLPVLVLYGLGTTVGAGIYALLGVVVDTAGMHAPLAFVAASVLASFTALSFCELSARLPRAGGEATYVHEAMGSNALTRGVGVLIMLAGCISAATVTRGFAGYAGGFAALPDAVWIVVLIGALGTLAVWGISESAFAAGAITLVEVGGLIWVFGVNADALGALPERWPEMLPAADPSAWAGIGTATLICFYAFLGFEDMVNVAEEVRGARRVVPIAILATLGCTVVVYLALTTVAILAVPPAVLADSAAPLALLYERGTGGKPQPIYLIGMLAMLNGALIQMIKASRLLYGLAIQRQMPRFLAYVHPRRRTPLTATLVAVALTLVLALALPIAPLAELTSSVTLVVFTLANVSLVVIKQRDPAPAGTFSVPIAIPWLGGIVSLGFVALEIGRRFTIA